MAGMRIMTMASQKKDLSPAPVTLLVYDTPLTAFGHCLVTKVAIFFSGAS
jgi:hypothetical protein